MFARLARAAGSRARRSVVLTPCRSSEGRMRAYGAVGKAGRMDERSVMEALRGSIAESEGFVKLCCAGGRDVLIAAAAVPTT